MRCQAQFTAPWVVAIVGVLVGERGSYSARQGGAASPVIPTAFDHASVIWSLRWLEGGYGLVGFVKEVQSDLLVRLALGPLSSTPDRALVGR
jgi:hypothetical protein